MQLTRYDHVVHVTGPAVTCEGVVGLRTDADVDAGDLPEIVGIYTPDGISPARVIGSDPDGWPVVEDPTGGAQ